MVDGPSGSSPDYKNLWQNYSQWLLDARSNLTRGTSLAEAKQAAGGLRASSTSAKVTREGAEEEFSSSVKSLRSGYTYTTLAKGLNPISFSEPKNLPLLEEGKNPTVKQKTYTWVGTPQGADQPQQDWANTRGSGETQGADQPIGEGSQGYYQEETIKIDALRVWGFSQAKYDQTFKKFRETFGRNPDKMEIFYSLKYGIAGPKKLSAAEISQQRAEQAAGKRGKAAAAKETNAQSPLGAKAKKDETSSPWT
jgi:hypothetical protein